MSTTLLATRLHGATHSEPGAQRNEDAVWLDEQVGIVVDGASGIGGDCWDHPGSAAQWFAQRLASALSCELAEPTTAITAALTSATATLRQEWAALSPTPVAAGPSGAVAGLRLFDDQLELFTLGDCTTLIELTDGSVEVLHDPTVPRLDATMVEEMVCAARHLGIRIPEARPAVKERIQRQRLARNTPGAYWIADLTGAGAPHALTMTLPQQIVRRVAIMSDGYAAAQTWLPCPSILLDAMEDDLAGVARRIRAEYAADPDFERYHRAKMIDDMTALLVRAA